MKTVYLIQSIAVPEQRYVGITGNLDLRIEAHNAGRSTHTSKFRQWRLIVSVTFEEERAAEAFEKYLKSGSGMVFASKHLW